MTVQEMINHLEKLDANKEVFMSRDEEGNGFAKFDCIDSEVNNKIILFPAGREYEWSDNYEDIE